MDGETRKTEFTSVSGEKLAAALELPRGRPRAYALFAHCFTCSKDIKAAREIARTLCASGIAVLRFDFTGLGGSEGDFANTNFSSNVDDLVSAADFLRDEFDAPALLIGHSLGGAAAIVAAAQMPEIKGVVVIGAPAQADHVVMQISERHEEIKRQGFAHVSLAGRPFTIKSQFLEDLSGQNVLNAVAALKKPLLVMHAPHDQTVGIDNATKIFAAAKHPKSFISLDTADHLLSKAGDARYAASVLAAWAERYLDEVPAVVRAPDFKGGAAAQSIDGEPLAVALSIDGYAMVSDGGPEDGGNGLGPNPTRIAEAALAACAAITVRMYARRKKWDLASVDVRIKRGGSADAHRPRLLEKELRVSGDLDAAQRARLLEIADKCPVHRMLTEGVEVQSRLA
ncbi:Bll2902 protein [hydrothermal vent metagenome]|uniref:Bll2902 protein n=1 Tax=hydrothermal vent metagenome TaxID=652676 RepID=A0A3B0RNT1_9ZZZZ